MSAMPRGAGDRDVDQDDEEHEENGEHDDEDDGAAPDLDETQKRYRSLSRDESAKADDEEFENICANLKRVSVTISRVLTAASPLIGRQESLGADAGEMPAAAGAADHAAHAGNGSNGVKSAGAPSAAGAVTPADMAGSMEDLRLWYETEVFADGEGQQRSWDVRKWAFMQQLSKELSRPLTSSPLPFLLEAPPNPSGADRTRWQNPSSSSLDTVTGAPSATAPSFGSARTASPAEAGWRVEGVLEGGLVFVGRSRCVYAASSRGARARAPRPPVSRRSKHASHPAVTAGTTTSLSATTSCRACTASSCARAASSACSTDGRATAPSRWTARTRRRAARRATALCRARGGRCSSPRASRSRCGSATRRCCTSATAATTSTAPTPRRRPDSTTSTRIEFCSPGKVPRELL